MKKYLYQQNFARSHQYPPTFQSVLLGPHLVCIFALGLAEMELIYP